MEIKASITLLLATGVWAFSFIAICSAMIWLQRPSPSENERRRGWIVALVVAWLASGAGAIFADPHGVRDGVDTVLEYTLIAPISAAFVITVSTWFGRRDARKRSAMRKQ